MLSQEIPGLESWLGAASVSSTRPLMDRLKIAGILREKRNDGLESCGLRPRHTYQNHPYWKH